LEVLPLDRLLPLIDILVCLKHYIALADSVNQFLNKLKFIQINQLKHVARSWMRFSTSTHAHFRPVNDQKTGKNADTTVLIHTANAVKDGATKYGTHGIQSGPERQNYPFQT
tara:strand:+ start:293 stop:628 length:336 start_codon:yes stop_codon:yes gene_type:complete